jgi:branched-chain amino acid transport system substrate-binding protein
MQHPVRTFRTLLVSAAVAAAGAPAAQAFDLLEGLANITGRHFTVTKPAPDGIPPFRVALVLPERGGLREAADRIRTGWRIAVSMSDGYVVERPIEVVGIDSSAAPESMLDRIRAESRAAPFDVYAGVIGARTAEILAVHAGRENKPLVLAGAVGDEVLAPTCRPHVARTSFGIGSYLSTSGRFLGPRFGTAVSLAPDGEASFAMIRKFTDAYRQSGGRILEQVWIGNEQRHDWSSMLARATQAGPKMIYAFFEERNAERIIYQHSTAIGKSNAALTGPEWLFGPRSLIRRGKHADGARFLATHLPALPLPANRLFVEAYRSEKGHDPDIYAYLGYENALAVLLAAAELHGQVHDAGVFVNAMKKLAYDGLMPRGDYIFDETNSAILNRLMWVEAVYDGNEARLREIAAIPVETPRDVCGKSSG